MKLVFVCLHYYPNGSTYVARAQRLGLRRLDTDDESKLARPLLQLMEDHKLDFHGTFRRLCTFRPALASSDESLQAFTERILERSSEAEKLDRARALGEWAAWLRTYAARIESERGEWAGEDDVDAGREREARAANPRFVLRQWLLEEVIKKVEADAEGGRGVLAKVLQMACSPFEPWGAEGAEDDSGFDAETKEERRYCGMGERKLLGFQCSCSS